MASAKKFLGRGRYRPRPKIPRIPGRPKENSNYCKCAQEICLTTGVHPKKLCPILCHTRRKIGATEVVYGAALRFRAGVRIAFHHRAADVPGHALDCDTLPKAVVCVQEQCFERLETCRAPACGFPTTYSRRLRKQWKRVSHSFVNSGF